MKIRIFDTLSQIITQPILKDIDSTYSDIDTTVNIELQEKHLQH